MRESSGASVAWWDSPVANVEERCDESLSEIIYISVLIAWLYFEPGIFFWYFLGHGVAIVPRCNVHLISTSRSIPHTWSFSLPVNVTT